MAAPSVTKDSMKRTFAGGHSKRREKKRQKLGLGSSTAARFEGSHDEVLLQDIRTLRINDQKQQSVAEAKVPKKSFERFEEVEVAIEELSSTGDGLGRIGEDVLVVPFTVPGDRVLAKVIRQHGGSESNDASSTTGSFYITDFVKVVEPSALRDDSLVQCKYFGVCSGCQFQMLAYSEQLQHKRRIVEKAFANFSGLAAHRIPVVEATIGSPLQYGYRTKLTPHFPAPPGGARRASAKGRESRARFTAPPPIGFMKKGTRQTLDIEECPIGTPAVQMGLRRERARVHDELQKYSRGATILLRESTAKVPRADAPAPAHEQQQRQQRVIEESGDATGDYVHVKTCTSEHNGISTEYVGGLQFQNRANSFFQNNNSILPTFVSYIRDRILPREAPSPSRSSADAPSDASSDGKQKQKTKKIVNLIDAYCGSGLFTVMLSSLFERSIGIDIDQESIAFARRNAQSNQLIPSLAPAPESSDDDNAQAEANPASESDRTIDESARVQFMAGTASALFASASSFDAAATVVVIDPPRKGCDEAFLEQLVRFRPARIVYVSCNVHTQARDIGWLLDAEIASSANETAAGLKREYVIESLVGFDFFPQTGHVEGVAVLSLQQASLSSSSSPSPSS